MISLERQNRILLFFFLICVFRSVSFCCTCNTLRTRYTRRSCTNDRKMQVLWINLYTTPEGNVFQIFLKASGNLSLLTDTLIYFYNLRRTSAVFASNLSILSPQKSRRTTRENTLQLVRIITGTSQIHTYAVLYSLQPSFISYLVQT